MRNKIYPDHTLSNGALDSLFNRYTYISNYMKFEEFFVSVNRVTTLMGILCLHTLYFAVNHFLILFPQLVHYLPLLDSN